MGVVDQSAHLLVDGLSRGVTHRAARVVATAKELTTTLLVVGKGAEGVAHAIGAHHLLGDVGGALQVVGSPVADLAEHNLFRRSAAQQRGNPPLQVRVN